MTHGKIVYLMACPALMYASHQYMWSMSHSDHQVLTVCPPSVNNELMASMDGPDCKFAAT